MSFATRDAARTHLEQAAGSTPGGEQPLAQYAAVWQAAQIHQRPSTREQMEARWRLHILPALGHVPLDEISRGDVQRAVTHWAKHLAPSTVHVTYGYLASALRAAADDGLIASTPCRRINLPAIPERRIVPLTAAQVHTIAERVPPRYRGMVLLAAATGMRGGELRGLTADRIIPAPDGGATVRVDRQLATTSPTWGPPKTGRSTRDITIGPRDAQLLADHQETFEPHPAGLIFTGRMRGPVSRNSMASVWHTATADLGPPARTGWHELRHFHASMLIAAGISVVAVAARLGHQDTAETLRTYGHLWHDDEARTVGAVEAGLWAT